MKGFLGFAVVVAITVAAVALAAETQISEKTVRSAIESFLQNPAASADPELTIVRFMEKNNAVQIIINPNGCYSWILDNKKYEHTVDLMIAFMAGNIRSQLDSGVYRNDPYSGLLAVFRVYRHLKKANPEWSIPEAENLLELHRQGKLMEHLAKEKSRAAEERKPQN